MQPLSYKFKYKGEVRHLDNTSFEPETHTIIGMEVRKAGKFSWQIKRFKLSEVEGLIIKIPNWYIDESIYE